MPNREKSYAAITTGVSIFETLVMPSLNTAASSGTSSNHSNGGLPLSISRYTVHGLASTLSAADSADCGPSRSYATQAVNA